MDNYIKDCVREVDGQSGHPFGGCCPPDVTHMRVKASTKTWNIVDYAIKHFVDDSSQQKIVISSSANGSTKAIGCAEIVKQKCKNKHKRDLYQMSHIGYNTVEELWKPKDSNLDTLKVVRKIPSIHILLSKEELDLTADGVQYKNHNICSQLTNKRDFKSNKTKQNRNQQKSKNGIKSNRKMDKELHEKINEKKTES